MSMRTQVESISGSPGREQRGWRTLALWGLLGAAVMALIAAIRLLPYQEWIEEFRDVQSDLGAFAPVAFILLFVGLTIFCLPGVPLNFLSGIFFGPILGGVLTVVASNTSAAVSFWLGRLARRPVAGHIERFPKANAIYRTMGRKGSWKLVAAVRLSHSLPFGLQNFLLGTTPVAFSAYLGATFLVTLPGIFAFAYFGRLVGVTLLPSDLEAPLGPWGWLLRGAGIMVAGGALIYLATVVRKAIKQHLTADDTNADPYSKS